MILIHLNNDLLKFYIRNWLLANICLQIYL